MTNIDVKLAFKVIEENKSVTNLGALHPNTIPIKGTENVKELFQKLDASFHDILIVTGSGD